jgi:hypothetical protein
VRGRRTPPSSSFAAALRSVGGVTLQSGRGSVKRAAEPLPALMGRSSWLVSWVLALGFAHLRRCLSDSE